MMNYKGKVRNQSWPILTFLLQGSEGNSRNLAYIWIHQSPCHWKLYSLDIDSIIKYTSSVGLNILSIPCFHHPQTLVLTYRITPIQNNLEI
jgi:hypothetical protein